MLSTLVCPMRHLLISVQYHVPTCLSLESDIHMTVRWVSDESHSLWDAPGSIPSVHAGIRVCDVTMEVL